MGLSRMCKKCRECEYKYKCNNKRMEALAYLTPTINIEQKNTINIGERGDGIINHNDIAKAISQEINRSMKLSINR